MVNTGQEYYQVIGRSSTGQESASTSRVVFMGTPEFSQTILLGLLDGGYDVVAAYTRPDKPVGRKREISETPVKRLANIRHIPVEQPVRFDEEAIRKLCDYKPDIIIVAAYGKILPESVLSLPALGCVNVHVSLLPRWRGASPIQNALVAGDTETGVTIMLMDAGMDTGPILAQESFPIQADDTADDLFSRMATDGSRLLNVTLPRWIGHDIRPMRQDDSKATLCKRIDREDGRIHWNDTAENIHNRYRGFHPWPGIFSFWKREAAPLRLKLTRISMRTASDTNRQPGEVFLLEENVAVQTGLGLIFIEELQPEGRAAMPIRDYVNGRPDFIGSILG
jgi:methionyl-tRNA formyltransferase